MIMYILDTDMLTLLVEEQLSGWYTQVRKARRPDKLEWAYRRLTDTVAFLAHLQILTYNQAAMNRYEHLYKAKIRIGRTDLRIAAVVLEHGATVVTRNVRDFGRVPGLQIEDWSA